MGHKLKYSGQVDRMTDEQIDKALRFINKCRYCILGTVNSEDGVHLSILTTQEKQELKELWYITRTSTQKVVDIRTNPRCEVLYTDNDNQITINGTAEIVTEPILKKMMSNIWVKKYIPEGPESDEMSLIKFTPEKIDAVII
ncbi:MAG: pyridoxamine 5'-phosphate oxidase family protein [Rikenellaceae bacterium]|nr:pyridoxamine 5'-phosphate oxidase family protein [Rikenellaceae bacterium]